MSAPDRAQIQRAVFGALSAVAPEADISSLDPRRPLREELDIDSMDFLNFVVGLHGALGIDVPERDYGKLATLEACVDYAMAALARR